VLGEVRRIERCLVQAIVPFKKRRNAAGHDGAVTDGRMQPMIKGTYAALADLLKALPVERWDPPSLCEGWRVREVVAHLTMPARYSEDAFMAELRDDGFDFTDFPTASQGATRTCQPMSLFATCETSTPSLDAAPAEAPTAH
jgi:uncharacterized protein (TIGR03083 family)